MAKKRIEIIASVEAYENLSSFKSINDLNEAVRAYKDQYKEDLNKTDLILLDILHRYSAKYTGVSFLTKNNLAKMLGCTRKTITRKCNKFEMLGIIKQYETKRSSDMKQTSNAIVILPIQGKIQSEKEQNVSQELNKMSHQKNKTFLKQIHNIKHLNMNRETSKCNPYIKLVPKRLQQYQAFFGYKIKSLYGRIWLAMKNLEVQIEQSIMQEIAHITFDKIVDYIKQGRNLSTEEMHKLAYTIAYNQLSERKDTREIVKDQQAITRALILLNKSNQYNKAPSINLFENVLNH